MKTHVKQLARWLLGEYSPYYIYAHALTPAAHSSQDAGAVFQVRLVDETALSTSSDALIRAQTGYAGEGSYAYAVYDDERIVGVCFYWFGERYRTRNFWPLADGEAKLVQIVVVPDARGRGIAPRLIKASSQDLMQQGFRRAYARIWHSNTPSVRAFERAGWTRIAFVFECYPFGRRQPLRFCLPCRGRPQ